MLNYIRVACAVPGVKVGDVAQNTADICRYMALADEKEADLVVFPELALTGYSCADLFFQDALWNAVKTGVKEIVTFSESYPRLTVVFGLPVKANRGLYNCAMVVREGKICGIVPKTYLPEYGTFSEKRWFCPGEEVAFTQMFDQDQPVPMGTNQVFEIGENAVLGVEICEDLFSPIPASTWLAMNGANVIVNLSASPAVAGKQKALKEWIVHQSGAQKCVYTYCSAGSTESTSDVVFSGYSVVAENGEILNTRENPISSDYLLIQDCDLGTVQYDRMENTTFRDACGQFSSHDYLVNVVNDTQPLRGDGSYYSISKFPFVPGEETSRYERCKEIFAMQVYGLKQRLATINACAVVGISGGLDSTLALLVAVEAMRQLGRPATDVHGITMPCFGTSDRTYQNAWELMRKLGVSAKEINIKDAVMQHFSDIGHDCNVHNTTYENAQARERTQILMDYAGSVGGIVVGTGDLSELALGWCTYNGDHMSMYAVNAGVPKTLIPWIVLSVAKEDGFRVAKEVLSDIVDTPISPELLPPDKSGEISQQTEDLVGPYALHDFFLYYLLRFGFSPAKIYVMACRAFANEYDGETVKKWLKTFYQRFFTQQFKRNCMPDGVKVGTVGLSPRGDWKMPSDASAHIWLQEVEQL